MDMRVASYGVIIRDGMLLLAHWNENGHHGWTLPGGGIDPGEDPADAAIREIREETGYDATLVRLLGIDSMLVAAKDRLWGTGPLHGLRIIYEAAIVGGELTNELDGSTDEARWFPLVEVPQLKTVSLVQVALRLYGDTAH